MAKAPLHELAGAIAGGLDNTRSVFAKLRADGMSDAEIADLLDAFERDIRTVYEGDQVTLLISALRKAARPKHKMD